MKLLTYTSRIQLILFLLLFGAFSVIFYLVLSWNVLRNVDEVLYNRKMNLLAYLDEHPDAPYAADNPLDDFTFYQIDRKSFLQGKETYTDTLIYEPVDDELDQYRKLVTHAQLHGSYYRLEIVKPHLEANEIIGTIAITLGGLFLGLALCFYLSQRLLSRKIWSPFYALLKGLRHYRLDQERMPDLPASRVEEFQLLNQAVTELTSKNKEVFESQKQFIENASHEMQTPLSVIQSRLEALIGQAGLTEKQSAIIEGIIASTQRLKKLNKTLLLLSKIENRQFLLTDQIAIKDIIDHTLEFFEEQQEKLNLRVNLETDNNLTVQGNTLITEILIQNLLKNAFTHNTPNGFIDISTRDRTLTVANSGPALPGDQEKVFNRFYKKSDNPETWGLGLAIARKIAEASGWSLSHRRNAETHIFELTF